MKPIAENTYDFEKMRSLGAVYVDKTGMLHDLIVHPGRQLCFISRPRRFGKSLMLSTLKAIFEGRKELFEGLAISKTDYDWKKYPVIHLDMACVARDSLDDVKQALNTITLSCASQIGISIADGGNPAQSFLNLWEEIRKQGLQVVVLVDEYDIPLQGFLSNRERLEQARKIMHDYYICLKSYSGNIRFLMMTGVTKLAKLSIFSGLNNLSDLTMLPETAGLLGYTHEEVKTYFGEHIKAFAEKEKTTEEAIFDKLLEWYDNYRFSNKSEVKVLNPVSVGFSLSHCDFDKYWNSTGASSLIIEALKKANKWPSDLDNISVMKSTVEVCLAEEMPAIPLLYQGGYLTIKDAMEDIIDLCIPNEEVRSAIVSGHIYSIFDTNTSSDFQVASTKASMALRDGDLDKALQIFRSTIAALPYEWLINDEGGIKIAFLDFFHAMRLSHVHCERQIVNGRVDAIVEVPDAVYIFEFKFDRSSQEAFDQILEKGYHKPYLASGKAIYGIGINFNSASDVRGIDEPVSQKIV